MTVYDFISQSNFNFQPIFDSKVHRFKIQGKKGLPGWFIGHQKDDFQVVVAGDWTTGEQITWHSKQESVDKKELEKARRKAKELARKAEIEREKDFELNSVKAKTIWNEATSDKPLDQTYLNKKQIDQPYSARFYNFDIAIDLKDVDDKIWSLQFIKPDGQKRFLTGGKIKGCFHLIGNPTDKIALCEGFATGVSIHKATGLSVACCMSNNNLVEVAKQMIGSKKYGDKKFIVFADNDKKTEEKIGKNPGIVSAKIAAKYLQTSFLAPEFNENQSGTDWNDYEVINGLTALKSQLEFHTENLSKYPSKAFGFYNQIEKGDKFIEVPDYDGLAEYMIQEKKLKCDDSLVYIWTGKFYRSISFLHLKNIIDKLVKKNSTPNVVNNFFNKSLIKSYYCFEQDSTFPGFLNCNNGLLNLKTKELEPHNDNYLIKYVLEHNYSPSAKCPAFLNALDLVTNNDEGLKKLIQQIFGYTIVGGYPKAHKAFMFYGPGGNGKSTILTALRNLIGTQNVAHVPLPLFDKPFSMISLDGKLANLIDETPKFGINAEAFKNIVSGGYVRAAHKRKDEFDLQVHARIIFACNSLPNFKDDSDGLLRRLIIVPFNNKIEESQMNRNIDNEIKAEMSGILNWAIEGLETLIDNDYQFIDCEATKNIKTQYMEETDSVQRFWSEEIIVCDGQEPQNGFISTNDLYVDYKLFCEVEGFKPVNKNNFSKKSCRAHLLSISKIMDTVDKYCFERRNEIEKENFLRFHHKLGRGFRYIRKMNNDDKMSRIREISQLTN